MTQIKIPVFSQVQVEQRTGLSREVLRKWELRYGFPQPGRGARGQRHYSSNDVHKLELISRLLRQDLRAGTLVALPVAALQALHDEYSAQTGQNRPPPETLTQATHTLLESLLPGHSLEATGLFLQSQLLVHGLDNFVAHLMPAFNLAVGEAWLDQRLSIAAEHHYTATLRQVVLRALPEPSLNIKLPRVLLTTPPGELHSLGLLALHAQLSLEGAHCINLDCQLPATEVLRVVHDFQVGVVAVSASGCMPALEFTHYVDALTRTLPEDCTLWLGGQGCAALNLKEGMNCTLFKDTSQAVRHWLSLAKAHRECV